MVAVARTDLGAVQVAHPGRGPGDRALRRAQALATPDALAATRTLPAPASLSPLLPGGALQRGTTVGIVGTGATSLALALASAASAAGSWLGVAGVTALGLAAAGELGVDLDRLLVVADPPGASWSTVVAALVDAVDVVVVRPPARLAGVDARRLQARARERGAVLCTLGDAWPQPADVRLAVTGATWSGATGAGSGRLLARRVEVVGGGRGAAARERRLALWLPGPDGTVTAAAPAGTDLAGTELAATDPGRTGSDRAGTRAHPGRGPGGTDLAATG